MDLLIFQIVITKIIKSNLQINTETKREREISEKEGKKGIGQKGVHTCAVGRTGRKC